MRGFTLIELLIVVAILSATALAAAGLLAEDRTQIRMDDTRVRLGILRHALLGFDRPVYGGEVRLSGYVADNGVLPERLADLLLMPADFAERAGVKPVYANSLDSECRATSGGTAITDDAARLMKGHRGNYLNGKAHNGVFRDGWGNVARHDDADHFGWQVAESAEKTLEITSLGADNLRDADAPAGERTEAELDQRSVIAANDWLIDLEGWRVTLKNVGAADITGDFALALLVFENGNAGGRWTQFMTTGSDCPTTLAAGESCVLSFGNKCAAGKTRPAKAPLGRHLLVLLDGNAPYALSGKKSFTQLSLYPDADRPDITLEIR
ncbi:hypothetical protein FACS1894101_3120 [Betaproteobacteria bacterium]|nr:hypothetical protein FACS1894101_3120 [Betaproteobacteria bacterium]